MFDGPFYLAVLPEAVKQQCETTPGHVPVVELHLADGTTLDLCHIVSLSHTWLAVAYFRNPAESEEVDQAFVPYPLVQWITLSTHPSHVRHIGFDIARSVAASQITPVVQVAPPAQAAPAAPTTPAAPPR